jgi:XTP/dITP diphosphohydrolase
MPKLLLATGNPGKVDEYLLLLRDLPYELATLVGEGIDAVVSEEGATMEENARTKAIAYARISGLLTMADDSGLEVDALGGEPGPLSRRYAGDNVSDRERIEYLLEKLNGVPWERRSARFRCVIALASPQGQVELYQGECQGVMGVEPRGEGGFGYDPIFYLPQWDKTMAELPLEVKNEVSHRGQAARELLKRSREGIRL